jgi:uncharacterized RDD family membrane protein YckC
MFIIVGGDGKEYGPATADQVRAWIAEGRADLATKAKALGSDEWRRVGDFLEFSGPPDLPPPLPPAPESAATLAERTERLAAWAVDHLVAFIFALPGALIIGLSYLYERLLGGGGIEEADSARVALGASVLLLGMLILLAFQLWMLVKRGQTVGKWLLEIRIVRFRDETNPGFVRAVLLRYVVPGVIGAVPWLGPAFTLVDILFIFRGDRRCIHDLIADTKVVKV